MSNIGNEFQDLWKALLQNDYNDDGPTQTNAATSPNVVIDIWSVDWSEDADGGEILPVSDSDDHASTVPEVAGHSSVQDMTPIVNTTYPPQDVSVSVVPTVDAPIDLQQDVTEDNEGVYILTLSDENVHDLDNVSSGASDVTNTSDSIASTSGNTSDAIASTSGNTSYAIASTSGNQRPEVDVGATDTRIDNDNQGYSASTRRKLSPKNPGRNKKRELPMHTFNSDDYSDPEDKMRIYKAKTSKRNRDQVKKKLKMLKRNDDIMER